VKRAPRKRSVEGREIEGRFFHGLRTLLGGDPSDPAVSLPPLLLATALIAFTLVAPLVRLGDASDYILTTESLLYDQDLRYEAGDTTRHLGLKPYDLDSPAGLRTIKGLDGHQYLGLWHSFYYSALAVPFYALFSYRGFLVLNALLLFVTALLLQTHLRRWNGPGPAWAFTILALGFSAAPNYLLWIHTETLQLALMAGFMFLWRREKIYPAALVLGVAIGAQTSFAVLAPLFLGLLLFEKRRLVPVVIAGAVVVAGAAPQLLANVLLAGALNPMAASGLVGPKYFSLDRVIRGLFDPAMGLLWFYPAIVPSLLLAPKGLWKRVALVAPVAIIVATTFSVGFVSHQVGLRYGNYVFPLVLFAVEQVRFEGIRMALSWMFVVLSGLGLLVNPLGNSVTMDINGKWFLPHQVARRLPGYSEDLTILWTRTTKLSGNVGIVPGWPDGWIAGGTPAKVMVMSVPPGDSLHIGVFAWFGPGLVQQQSLRIETLGGTVYDDLLPAGVGTMIIVPLGPSDVLRASPDALGICIFTLSAAPWVPMETKTNEGDPRRLGVRVDEISIGGQRLR
jgi:hypothetical protein